MITNTPLVIESISFCDININNKENIEKLFDTIDTDKRHDFLIDSSFAGIAIKTDFSNSRYFTDCPAGIRRNVSFTLIDFTLRLEIASRVMRVSMPLTKPYKTTYCTFMTDDGLTSGHTYKIIIRDENTGESLQEKIFHLFGEKELGHPQTWYTVTDGGIRPEWETFGLFRSIKSDDSKILNVRFNLELNFGKNIPLILPELEIRLYYPGEGNVKIGFIEPLGHELFSLYYTVELPFSTSPMYHGVYYAELLCMEYPIAGFVFSTSGIQIRDQWCGEGLKPLEEYSPEAAEERYARLVVDETDSSDDEFESALNDFIKSETESLDKSDAEICEDEPESNPEEESSESTTLLASLDHLTGLGSVKEKLTVYERIVRFNKMREDRGLPVSSMPLHAMFLGSPGTGKTTVARMMGLMLRRAGVLSKGHVVIRERSTLLGQNYNSEAEKTLAAIEEAQGGILFIDEAYQLYQPNDSRDPGKFVIETLLTALSDTSKRDWMLILAGYPDEMKQMFSMNPGFKSRIPDSNFYYFDDFTESELMEIAEKYLSRNEYTLAPDAHKALSDRLKTDFFNREKNFGNARHVINLIQTEILPAMAIRVTEATDTVDNTSLTLIQASDIPQSAAVKQHRSTRVGFSI